MLHIQNLSNHCRHKYDPSISRIFSTLTLAGFLRIGPTVWCQRTSSLFAGYIQSIMLQWTPLRIISLHVGKSWSPKPGFFSLAPPVVQLYLGSLSNWLEEIKLAAVHICRKPASLPGRGASSRRQPPPSPPRADEVHAAFRRSAIIAGIPYVTRASDRCSRGSHCRRPTSKCAKS